MRLIALVGPKRSGKSEIAKILEWSGFACIKFSQPLKDMLLALPGITLDHIEGHLKDVPCDVLMGQTPRHAMQTLGTEWGRDKIDTDIWLNLWKERIKGLHLVVVDDCRFLNEAFLVKSLGGEIWSVKREHCSYEGHSSETQMSKIESSMTFSNNGSLDDLRVNVTAMLGDVYAANADRWAGEDIGGHQVKPHRNIEGSDD